MTEPVEESAEEPAAEPAEEEPVHFEKGYVYVKGSTDVYSDMRMSSAVGSFTAKSVAYAVSAYKAENPQKDWLKIRFLTDNGELSGYVRAESVIALTEDEVASLKIELQGKDLPVIPFKKAEEPKTEEPAAEEPQAEEPTAEEPQAEEPVAEEPQPEEPAAEEPQAEEPAAEEPQAEEPADEEPQAEEPAAEEPVAEEPQVEEPVAEESKAEEPAEKKSGENKEKNEPKVIRETEEPKTIEEYGIPLDEIETLTLEAVNETGVRLDPDGLSTIFLKLEEGTEVTVLEQKDGWYVVLIDDKIGYVYADDLTAKTEEAEEPALEDEKPAEKAETPKKVTIFSSRTMLMTEGEPVYLTSKLEGFEDCEEILYIWKVDKGSGFEEIPDANEATYSFAATEETLTWSWHLTVLYR